MLKRTGRMPGTRRSRTGPALIAAAFLTAAGAWSGCAPAPPKPAAPKPATHVEPASSAAPVAGPDTLQQGDMLKIKFHFHPELNEEQPIRRDGMIAMPLVGEVRAEGLTPDQLRRELVDRYGVKIRNPEIAVAVRSYKSPRVFVGGEVRNPGVKMIEGRLTVLASIMQAGGLLNRSADSSRVVVVRNVQDKRTITVLDLRYELEATRDEVTEGAAGIGGSFLLKPYDVVFVPRTNIDVINQWVDQYINQIIPGDFSFDLSHEIP